MCIFWIRRMRFTDGSSWQERDFRMQIIRHRCILRTTEEMLEEFSYLGSEKAEEVVITNTNKIADMIEKISPIHPDKCPPVIENSEQDAARISVITKAHEMYGDAVAEDRGGPPGQRAEFYYFQWLCGNVYHCTEAGVEVQ